LGSLSFSRASKATLRWHAWLTTVAAVILFLTACSTRRKEIALLTPTSGVVLWDAVHTGAVLQAAACGLKVHYDAPPRADDLRTQLELFKTFSESHYGTIVVVPIQARAMRDPISRAASAGHRIIVIGSALGIRNPNITYVLNDEEVGGRLAAQKVGDVLHGKGTIAVMGVDLSATSILTREHAFEQELSTRFPSIRVVQRTHGSTNLFEEQQSAEELLAGDDNLDAIVALTSFATRGAFYAVDARRPKHHLHIIGFDQDLTIPIRDGEIDGVVAQRANDIGKLVSQLACDHLEGKSWGGPHVLTPFLITPANVNTAEVWSQMNLAWWELADEKN
jgi:ribose transport system substrate-binding protein